MDGQVVRTTVAALYVEAGGSYFGLPGVEPWDETRDARKYRGPHPVVAHPPCQRWGKSEPSFPPEAVEKYGLAYCKRAGELAFKGGGKDNSHRIGTPTEFRDLLIGMAATVAA